MTVESVCLEFACAGGMYRKWNWTSWVVSCRREPCSARCPAGRQCSIFPSPELCSRGTLPMVSSHEQASCCECSEVRPEITSRQSWSSRCRMYAERHVEADSAVVRSKTAVLKRYCRSSSTYITWTNTRRVECTKADCGLPQNPATMQ